MLLLYPKPCPSFVPWLAFFLLTEMLFPAPLQNPTGSSLFLFVLFLKRLFWNGSSWRSPFCLFLAFVPAVEAAFCSPGCFIFAEYSLVQSFMFLRKADCLLLFPAFLCSVALQFLSIWGLSPHVPTFLSTLSLATLLHPAGTFLMLTSGCSLLPYVLYISCFLLEIPALSPLGYIANL